MGQHDIGRKRVRTKRIEPVPHEVATQAPKPIDALIGGVACCVTTTVATFRNEALVSIARRHMGRRCAGDMEPVSVPVWRKERGLK